MRTANLLFPLQALLDYPQYRDASPEHKIAFLERGVCPPGGCACLSQDSLVAAISCKRVALLLAAGVLRLAQEPWPAKPCNMHEPATVGQLPALPHLAEGRGPLQAMRQATACICSPGTHASA
jgi:hypothetical protein